MTALYLVQQVDPRGKTVLVNAAAGGVGTLLVQLAKRAGAKREIGGRYAFEQVADAHRAPSQRQTVGKLVLVA